MLILFAGDWHGNLEHAQHMLEEAHVEKCDAIVQLGDFGAWEHEASGREYLNQLSADAISYGIPIYWIDGNHDKWSLTMQIHATYTTDPEGFVRVRNKILYIPRGTRWTWDGVSFLGLGGAYSVDKTYRLHMEREREQRTSAWYGKASQRETLWFPEEELTDDQIKAVLADSSPVDIMLTHDKPRASNPAWNRKDLSECWPNQDKIQSVVNAVQPRLLLHGHLHYAYTDFIRCGDGDAHTWVMGLSSEPWGQDPHGEGYNIEESYTLIDTRLIRENTSYPRES